MLFNTRLSNAGILLTAGLLLALAIWIRWQPPSFDAQVLLALAEHRRPWLDELFRLTTWAGSLYVLVPAGAAMSYLLIRRGHTQAALGLACALLSATVLAYGLKLIVDRPRPPLETPLVHTPLDYAFPSNHASQATAFFLMLVIVIRELNPAWRWPVGLAAAMVVVLVGLSRLYLQVHYPTDVLAGGLTGVLVVGLCLRSGRDR